MALLRRSGEFSFRVSSALLTLGLMCLGSRLLPHSAHGAPRGPVVRGPNLEWVPQAQCLLAAVFALAHLLAHCRERRPVAQHLLEIVLAIGVAVQFGTP